MIWWRRAVWKKASIRYRIYITRAPAGIALATTVSKHSLWSKRTSSLESRPHNLCFFDTDASDHPAGLSHLSPPFSHLHSSSENDSRTLEHTKLA